MSFQHLEIASPPVFADEDTPIATLRSLVTGDEISHVTYLGLFLPNVPPEAPLYFSTYPGAWAHRYLDQHYFDVDPTITIGTKGHLPFDWQEHPIPSRKAMTFMGEAREFGLQPQGWSLPIRGAHNELALFSVNSALPAADWAEFKKQFLGTLALYALHFHQRVLERLGVPQPVDVSLSPREREVLLWAAAGKTLPETAIIMGLRESSMKLYVRNAMGKLGATNKTQAVATAFRLGLLR